MYLLSTCYLSGLTCVKIFQAVPEYEVTLLHLMWLNNQLNISTSLVAIVSVNCKTTLWDTIAAHASKTLIQTNAKPFLCLAKSSMSQTVDIPFPSGLSSYCYCRNVIWKICLGGPLSVTTRCEDGARFCLLKLTPTNKWDSILFLKKKNLDMPTK